MAVKVLALIFTVLFYVNCSTLPECPANQVFNTCNSACPKTCENKDNTKPQGCTANCVSGCGCKSEFVYDENKNCIAPIDCPKIDGGPTGGIKCPRTEVYSECDAHCQMSCEGEPDKCTKKCEPGCVCPKDFIRSKRVGGTCIPNDKCAAE